MATILTSIPKDANVTKIDYEGPRIALYTDKPRFLMENNEIISNLVNQIKKRIVIRTDEKIRKSEEDDMKYNERVSRWQQLTNDNYNKAEIIIAKQRHGPIGSIKMHFDANYTKFSDLITKDYDNIIE